MNRKTLNRIQVITMLGIFLTVIAAAEEEKPKSVDQLWEDYSTAEDGFSPHLCTDANQQCVFLSHDALEGLRVTSVTVRQGVSGTSELRNFAAADAACRSLKNWGGHSDWHLPSFFELLTLRKNLLALFQKYPFLNSGTHYFWTDTDKIEPKELPSGVFSQDPKQYWAIQLEPFFYRQVDPRAAINFICVHY